MRTEAPPEVWEAATEDVDFIPLLGEMIAAALGPGSPLSALTLSASNVTVTTDPHAPDDPSLAPPAGSYVAVTVAGPGAWSPDWSWLPRAGAAPSGLPVPPERLVAAQVRYAYGRAFAAESSVTVFLARAG